MATAKKLPSGNWNCRVFSHKDKDGKPVYVSFTAPTKMEAQRRATEFAANRNRHKTSYGITVGEAIDQYIEIKSNVLAETTLRGYISVRKNHFGPLENKRIDTITSADLQAFVNGLAAAQSPKTVRNIYGLLISSISMYSDATYHVTLPQKAVIERHIPIDDEVNKLIQNADDELRLCIALAAMGTLRLGEVCGLTYKDVLRSQNAVYVHTDYVQGINGYIHKEIPKTSESVRVVVFPPDVIAMIEDGPANERIIKATPGTIDKRFKRLRESIGLECRFHDLRHYAASIMHAMGIPDVYIMERGGWKSDTVLKSIYRNSLSDKSREFTTKVNDYLDKKLLSGIKDNDDAT